MVSLLPSPVHPSSAVEGGAFHVRNQLLGAVEPLANKPQLAPRTRELYYHSLRMHVLPYLGMVNLCKVTPQMVSQWNATLLPKHPGTLIPPKAYRTLRAIMNTAVEDGLIPRSPCVIKGAGIEPHAERPVASPEQVWELTEAIAPRFRALILVAGLTGLRWVSSAGPALRTEQRRPPAGTRSPASRATMSPGTRSWVSTSWIRPSRRTLTRTVNILPRAASAR